MQLCVVGAGYVGLVTAACLADLGHTVVAVERDPDRRASLEAARVPFFEPGLDDLVERGRRQGRLQVRADVATGVRGARVVFLAVGTPSGEGGQPDLSQLDVAFAEARDALAPEAVVVIKSTVPVGTADRLRAALDADGRTDVAIVSNPEFLAEGTAVRNFTEPDRIVLGYADARAGACLERLYAPYAQSGRPILHMDHRSAEMAKYAANALLAARVSLMNELAALCEVVAADVEQLRRVAASDPRIGAHYLFAGAGFGGSCFPKDLLALERIGRSGDVPTRILSAVREVNARQKERLFHKLDAALDGGVTASTRVAVWGLSFKPGTDDLRDAPSLVLVDQLLAAGATVVVYDPEAMERFRARHGERVRYAQDAMSALDGADALVVVTEWPVFRSPDWSEVARRLRGRIMVDGRNLYDPAETSAAGLRHVGFGRPLGPTHPTPEST